ncbi:hypothetical protein [Streptomyces chartreusis]
MFVGTVDLLVLSQGRFEEVLAALVVCQQRSAAQYDCRAVRIRTQ